MLELSAMGAVLFTVKAYVLVLYGAFGFALLWSAASARVAAGAPTGLVSKVRFTGHLILAGAGGLMMIAYLTAGSVLLICAVGIAAAVSLLKPGGVQPSTVLDSVSVSAITLSLVWWCVQPSAASPLPLAVFALILVILTLGFRGDDSRPFLRGISSLSIVSFLAMGCALVADLGGYRGDRAMITTLVHHWGAFIGPVLHVEAGLVPFYDVPLQYGLGPTAALAAACRTGDCWSGAHALFALTDITVALLVLAMALTTSRRHGWAWTCAVTLVVFAAAFLWPGFPIEGSALMAMPSASGVRFLPVTAVACLWFFGRPIGATLAAIPAVLWSPESAAMTIAVQGLCGTQYLGLRNAVASSAAILFGSYSILIVLHRAVFGVWMDPAAFLEYLLHVPGPLPIDPMSDILLLAIILGLGGWLVVTAPDATMKGRDLATTALLFATACYCFGRSHPNNICNLAPFLALVGLRALDRAQNAGRAIVAHGLAISVAALAFSPWRIVPLDPHVGVGDLLTAFPAFEADVASIRDKIPRDPDLGVADFGPTRSRYPTETIVWTPMDPSSLWRFVPSERRKLYIVRAARRLRRSGWGLFTPDQHVLMDDLKAGYDIRVERRVDVPVEAGGKPVTYTVACFDPKPAIATVHVGPKCPNVGFDGLGTALAVE